MILSIFVLIFSISIVLLIVGLFLQDDPIILIGFSFLFISGSILLAGNVQYKTGEEIRDVYIYGDNYSGYHWDYDNPPISAQPDVNLFHRNETITYTYNSFNDTTSHWFGVYLMILSVLGSALTIMRLRQERDEGI